MGMWPSASLAYGFIVEPADLRRLAADCEDKVEGVLNALLRAVNYDGDQSPGKAVLERIGVRVDYWRISQNEHVVVTSGEELHQDGWCVERVQLPAADAGEARVLYAGNLLGVYAEPSWLLKTDFS